MKFTYDWFSSRIPQWQKHLSEFAGKNGVKALELGGYEGRSCIWLCQNILTGRDASITCIDHFKGEPYRNFLGNILEAGVQGMINIVRGDTHKALSQLTEKFDIIYIDADHTAASVHFDSATCFRLLNPGGVMIFDDYEWIHPEGKMPPKPAIDAFMQIYKDKIDVLHIGWQVFVKKK